MFIKCFVYQLFFPKVERWVSTDKMSMDRTQNQCQKKSRVLSCQPFCNVKFWFSELFMALTLQAFGKFRSDVIKPKNKRQ